jgi:hypothetical protein
MMKPEFMKGDASLWREAMLLVALNELESLSRAAGLKFNSHQFSKIAARFVANTRFDAAVVIGQPRTAEEWLAPHLKQLYGAIAEMASATAADAVFGWAMRQFVDDNARTCWRHWSELWWRLLNVPQARESFGEFGIPTTAIIKSLSDSFAEERRDAAHLDDILARPIEPPEGLIGPSLMRDVESLYLDLPGRFRAHRAAMLWTHISQIVGSNGIAKVKEWAIGEAVAQGISGQFIRSTEQYLYDLADEVGS